MGKADKSQITVTDVGTITVVPDAVRFKATVLSIGSITAADLVIELKSVAAFRKVVGCGSFYKRYSFIKLHSNQS